MMRQPGSPPISKTRRILHTIFRTVGLSYAAFMLLIATYYKLRYGIWLNPIDGVGLLQDGQYLQHLYSVGDSSDITSLAFSSDGKILAAGRVGGIDIWDLKTNQLLHDIKIDSGAQMIALSPDGQEIISGSREDNRVNVWNIKTGTRSRSLIGHTGGTEAIALSSNGKTLVTASNDDTIKVWDLPTGKLLWTLASKANDLAISPDSANALSNSEGEPIKVWNLQSGKLARSLPKKSASSVVAMNPHGQTLATTRSGKVLVWDWKTGKLSKTLSESGSVAIIAFSQDGSKLVGIDNTGSNQEIYVWDVETGDRLHTFQGLCSRLVAPLGLEDTTFQRLCYRNEENFIRGPEFDFFYESPYSVATGSENMIAIGRSYSFGFLSYNIAVYKF